MLYYKHYLYNKNKGVSCRFSPHKRWENSVKTFGIWFGFAFAFSLHLAASFGFRTSIAPPSHLHIRIYKSWPINRCVFWSPPPCHLPKVFPLVFPWLSFRSPPLCAGLRSVSLERSKRKTPGKWAQVFWLFFDFSSGCGWGCVVCCIVCCVWKNQRT